MISRKARLVLLFLCLANRYAGKRFITTPIELIMTGYRAAGIVFVLLCPAFGSKAQAEPPPEAAEAADDGFFSNGARDVFALIGLASAVLTAAGLWVGWKALKLTIEQMRQSAEAARHAATVAEAARDAAIRATNETREQYNRYVGLHAGGLVTEARHYVHNEDFRLAALRLHDLAELFAHIAGQKELWGPFSERLRLMEESFHRVAGGEIQFKGVSGRWRTLHLELSAAIAKDFGPFQPAMRSENDNGPTISGDARETFGEVASEPSELEKGRRRYKLEQSVRCGHSLRHIDPRFFHESVFFAGLCHGDACREQHNRHRDFRRRYRRRGRFRFQTAQGFVLGRTAQLLRLGRCSPKAERSASIGGANRHSGATIRRYSNLTWLALGARQQHFTARSESPRRPSSIDGDDGAGHVGGSLREHE